MTTAIIVTTIQDGTVGHATLREFSVDAIMEWLNDAEEENTESGWFREYEHEAGGGLTTVVFLNELTNETIYFIGFTKDYT